MSFNIEESKYYEIQAGKGGPPVAFAERMMQKQRKISKAEIDLKLAKASIKR